MLYIVLTPLVFNNTVVAVCGHYVCEASDDFYNIDVLKFSGIASGELITQDSWCNNIVQCDSGGVDEKFCAEEEEDQEEMFQCRFLVSISISRVCDRKCDCLCGLG